jgi:lysophospholipase L1-like esterase
MLGCRRDFLHHPPMKKFLLLVIAALALVSSSPAQEFETKPDGACFEKFAPAKAPGYDALLLQPGDRLAIIGDSITEQKMYSRIIETYLTVCVPELKITARQFGWSGETAEQFLRRMTNDCLRFTPTVATLCYGMNDHGYSAFAQDRATWYSNNYSAVAQSLTAHGARVVLGAPGCVGKVPRWARDTNAPVEDLNLNLCQLRNIDIQIAEQQHTRFADVFWPMFTAGFAGQQKFGPAFAIAGQDGVHPDWAGHLLMARAFLKALGLHGDIGTFTVDLAAGTASVSAGHTLDSFANHKLTITSARYPFCAAGAPDKDNSMRAAMNLVPFNGELNRLMLLVKNGTAENYTVTWGDAKRTYSTGQLAAGVNLAADFEINPFSAAFNKVDEAVAAKQKYETRQIKELFHGPEGYADLDLTAEVTEKARQPLANAIAAAFVPVTHILTIEAQ